MRECVEDWVTGSEGPETRRAFFYYSKLIMQCDCEKCERYGIL
jgi:hypothetical protein